MPSLLVVEDREMAKDMLMSEIRKLKLFDTIDCVDSFEAGAAQIEENTYDCILLDIQIYEFRPMPNGERQPLDNRSVYHGLNLLSALLPAYAEKIYVFSALIPQVASEIEELGMTNRLLPRPIPIEVLHEKFKSVLGIN